MYLYSLKNTGSLWMTSNKFNVHQRTVKKVVYKATLNYLSTKMIKVPLTQDEMHKKVAELLELTSLNHFVSHL